MLGITTTVGRASYGISRALKSFTTFLNLLINRTIAFTFFIFRTMTKIILRLLLKFILKSLRIDNLSVIINSSHALLHTVTIYKKLVRRSFSTVLGFILIFLKEVSFVITEIISLLLFSHERIHDHLPMVFALVLLYVVAKLCISA